MEGALDAGSIPAYSSICGKEGPIEDGKIPYRCFYIEYNLVIVIRRDPTKMGGFLITCGKEGPIEDGRIPYRLL